ASMFVKFMRYFLPIYPFLILFAAYFIIWLWRYASTSQESRALRQAFPSNQWKHILNNIRPSRALVLSIAGIVIVGTLIYATAFSSIYGRMNTRIAASRWMYQNLPQG